MKRSGCSSHRRAINDEMGKGGVTFFCFQIYTCVYIYMYIEKYFTIVFKEVDLTRYFDQQGSLFHL